MIIRNAYDWNRYTLQYRTLAQVPDSPPSYPVIVNSLVIDSPYFVCHVFYEVYDMEKPTEETEYMYMLPEFPEFQRVALEMLGCNFEVNAWVD